MHYRIHLVAVSEQGAVLSTTEVARLNKRAERLEDVGLNRGESKRLVHDIQRTVVLDQVDQYIETARRCLDCGKPRRIKGIKESSFRTLFGNVAVPNPRIRRCKCQKHGPRSWRPLKELLSSRTSPEFQLVQTKWAALVPYFPVVQLLKDVLPVDEKLSPQAVKNTVTATSSRCEQERLDGRKRGVLEPVETPVSDGPIRIAVDGAYLRPWHRRSSKFAVIVGKVSSEHGGERCFGFLASQDPRPDVRSLEALQPHGIDDYSEIYWLSDGEEGLRKYQWPFSENCTFILDWFHIAMRFRWLEQLARGAASLGADEGRTVHKEIAHAKWSLWHGNRWEATLYLDTLNIGELPEDHPKVKRIWEVAKDLSQYLSDNEDMLVNYGALYHDDRPISTAPVESAVNFLVKKRLSKKQQMGWTEEGAHHLLQVRAQTLNDELEDTFRRWYPGLAAA